MAAREEILAAVRRAAPPVREHPGVGGLGVRFPDPAGTFAETVAAVGGTCLRVADLAAADRALRELPVYREARRIASLVPGVGAGTVDPAAVSDPHDLEGLDVSVLPGALGVAENGAVWLEAGAFPHRALYVIPEHLVLVLGAADVVSDMHQAYDRIAVGPGFGVFVSGPSKTADIEQALVIGAHGARSCTVLLTEA
ncbi:MAG TPA: LUD domain-containing protein [Anaeromyxobacteraceae bacterium]